MISEMLRLYNNTRRYWSLQGPQSSSCGGLLPKPRILHKRVVVQAGAAAGEARLKNKKVKI